MDNDEIKSSDEIQNETSSKTFEQHKVIKHEKKTKWVNFLQPFRYFSNTFKEASNYRKVAMILNFIFPGAGSFLNGVIEYGIIVCLCFFALCIGEGFLTSLLISGTISLEIINLIVVFLILNVCILLLYFSSFKNSTLINQKINYGFSIEKFIIIGGIKKIIISINEWFRNLIHQFKVSQNREKTILTASFFVMGLPLLWYKQAIKGIVFFLIQALTILYFIARGVADIQNFFILPDSVNKNITPLIFGVIAFVILFFFIVAYVNNYKIVLKNVTNTNEKRQNENTRSELKNLVNKKFYVTGLVIPIIGALVFTVIPLIFMILIAFTNYSLVTVDGYNNFNVSENIFLQWVGFDTFKRIFAVGANLQDLLSVFAWTMIWATIATFSCYFGGLFLAMLLNKKCIKGKIVYRSLFVVAMALPQFVSLLVVRTMFTDYGPINQLLISWGWISEAIPFWESEYLAKILILFINMWVGIPYYMLLMSGLLINIPKDYYEAATIDGASKWQQFSRITFPNILYMTTPLLITSFVSNINNFNVIYFLTSGGTGIPSSPSGTAAPTDILITWLYNLTTKKSDFNFGGAIGIIMFIITATLSLVVFRKSKAYNAEEEYR